MNKSIELMLLILRINYFNMKFIILLVFTFCVNALMLRSGVKDKITEGVI